ncbi:MAG: hypothetical protein WBH47_07660 [Streptosporangiaceae bacterium]
MTSPFVLVSADLKRDARTASLAKLAGRKDMLNFAAGLAARELNPDS